MTMKRFQDSNKFVRNASYSVDGVTQMNLLAVIENASHFEKIIEQRIQQFEKQGISVSVCTEYFDSTIDKFIAKILSQLETAHSDNASILRRYLHRRAAEKIRLENLLKRLDAEIADTTLEYNMLKQMVDKSDPLKNATVLDEEQKEEEQNE